MRVWIVDASNVTVRTYRVSGRFGQPDPGTYHVFSRSTFTCNIDHPNICMRFMVRFAQGPLGDNIGFHEIPKRDGVPVQSDAQLGQALSGGCVRQATAMPSTCGRSPASAPPCRHRLDVRQTPMGAPHPVESPANLDDS